MAKTWQELKPWLDANGVVYEVQHVGVNPEFGMARSLTIYKLSRQDGPILRRTLIVMRLTMGARQPADSIPDEYIINAALDLRIDAQDVFTEDVGPVIGFVEQARDEAEHDESWTSLTFDPTSQMTTEQMEAAADELAKLAEMAQQMEHEDK